MVMRVVSPVTQPNQGFRQTFGIGSLLLLLVGTASQRHSKYKRFHGDFVNHGDIAQNYILLLSAFKYFFPAFW